MATVPVADGNMRGAFTFVTHLNPSELAAMNQTVPGINNVRNVVPPKLRGFLKGEPKALGVSQIMIGVVTILFGIVLTIDTYFAPYSVISGIVYWGPVIYIISGALAVAAENNINPCLVKGSLGMNVVSALTATTTIGMLSWDLALYYCNSYDELCYSFEWRSKAISAVLMILSFLELIISICVSAFGCKAVCGNNSAVPVVTVVNPAHTYPQAQFVTMANPAHTHPQASFVPVANPAHTHPQAQFVTTAHPAHTHPQASFVPVANPTHTHPQDTGYGMGHIPRAQVNAHSTALQNPYEWRQNR